MWRSSGARCPRAGCSQELGGRLAAAAGGADVFDDSREARVAHAAGRSYPDLVRLRAGDGSGAPGRGAAAAVAPTASPPLLAACADAGVAVVPFGGGTSVVGGVETLRDGFAAAVSLDLTPASTGSLASTARR